MRGSLNFRVETASVWIVFPYCLVLIQVFGPLLAMFRMLMGNTFFNLVALSAEFWHFGFTKIEC